MSILFEKIERAAEKTLELLDMNEIPVPVEKIANKLKIKVSRAPSRDFSGLLIRKDGHALIGINSSEAPVRQRFSIAHELGHFLLHEQKDTFVDYRDNRKDIMRTPREREANIFAASLLMPKNMLIKDFKRIAHDGFTEDELKILASKYDVSEDSMRFRLMNLHLLEIKG